MDSIESAFNCQKSQNSSNVSRQRRAKDSQSFLQESFTSSLDFPTYIPWQTLSTDVSDKLRNGSVKINRSNCIEWTIKEENERTPLVDKIINRDSSIYGSNVSSDKCISAAVSAGGISWPVASFLLINCALGAGIINYPSAYDRLGGVLNATLIQIGMILILGGTMIVLVYASNYKKRPGELRSTYHDVLLSLCGKRYQQLGACSILLTCYGVCVTFLIIIGDQYDRIFASHLEECHWFIDRRFTITVTAIGLILPMCYYQRLDFLRHIGTLGVFAMLYVVFLNIYGYLTIKLDDVPIRTSPPSLRSMIAVFPVICFAYQCHEIVIPVYACMEKRDIKNFAKTTVMTLVILFFLYCAAGTTGYLTFGSKVIPDIMQLYDAKDPFVLIGVLAICVKMIATYPPMIFCGRGALDGLYAELAGLSAEDFILGERKRRIVITTVWFFTSLLLAIFTPNIGVVIELLGSLASCNVFIFPSLCLLFILKSSNDKIKTSSQRRKWLLVRIFGTLFACTLILVGILMFIIVLIQVHEDITSPEKESIHKVLC